MPVNNLYYNKYIKYKNKYLNLQNQIGGSPPEPQPPPPPLLRQHSTFISCQGIEPTCWAHNYNKVIYKANVNFFVLKIN